MSNGFNEFIACPKTQEDLKVQSNEVFKCLTRESLISNLMNDNKTKGVIHLVTTAQSQAGNVVAVRRLMPLDNLGVINCETLEGKEACSDNDYDYIRLGMLRNAQCIKTCGVWDLQRQGFKRTRDEALSSLKDWLLTMILKSMFNQLGSYTGAYTYYNGKKETIVPQLKGFNEIEPSTSHYKVITTPANGNNSMTSVLANITNNPGGEDTLQAKDKLTLSAIRQLKAIMANDNNICGNGMLNTEGAQYILFLHPSQVAALKADPEWRAWVCCADEKGKNNRLTSGAEGTIDGIVLRTSDLVPYGLHADGTPNTNVRRAILVGVDAVELALGGKDITKSSGKIERVMFKLDYSERDYGNYGALAISSIFGLKKTRFNNKDTSTLVISSYVEDITKTAVEATKGVK